MDMQMHAGDMTNQQLFEALSDMLGIITDNMATHDDIKRLDKRIDKLETKLERQIKSVHSANIKHHLETRHAIGDLNRRYW